MTVDFGVEYSGLATLVPQKQLTTLSEDDPPQEENPDVDTCRRTFPLVELSTTMRRAETT